VPSPPAVVRGRRSVTHPSEIALLPLTGPPVPPDSVVRHRSRLRSVRACVFSFVTVSSAGDLMACVASAGRLARPATCCACLRSFCWGTFDAVRSEETEGTLACVLCQMLCIVVCAVSSAGVLEGGRYLPVRICLVPLSSDAVVEVVSRGESFLSLSPATQPFPFPWRLFCRCRAVE
jgi:hypothetical protein